MLAALVLVAAGCAAAGPPPIARWQSEHAREHPLVGRLWDVEARRFVGAPAVIARLALTPFVLLGEKHDNADHHHLQAWILRALVVAGRHPAVAFEMLAADQAPALSRHLERAPRDAAGLGSAVGWELTGWPPWRLYQPIAEVALDADLPVVAANLPLATARAVGRRGVAALDPPLVSRLGLNRPLSAGTRAAMVHEIRQAHCGYAPEAALDGMITAQRARDAHMAARVVAAAEPDGALLIAGIGHVREDWGVPAHLAILRPDAPVGTVALLEVRADAVVPEDYAERFGGPLPFNFVWFTPRVDNVDPCEKFRPSLERLERGGQAPR